MIFAIFEDEYWQNFSQVAYTRPVYRLLTSRGILLEELLKITKDCELHAYIRNYLVEVERERLPELKVNKPIPPDDHVIFVNGLAKNLQLFKLLLEKLDEREFILLSGQRVLGAHVRARRLADTDNPEALVDRLKSLLGEVEGFEAPDGSLYRYPWEMLEEEAPPLPVGIKRFDPDTKVAVLGDPANVLVPDDCEIEPFTVFDARRGPIRLGRGVRVESGSKIIGPCTIGDDSIVYGGRVGPSLFTGPTCRISAEIEYTIMLGFSNKHHYGYIGHSMIGEWVNIAAGTTTSNLKTTYGEVKVVMGGKVLHTGRQFLGSIMGDHVRTMIDTQLMTGKLVGPFSVLGGVVAKNIPPFTGINLSREIYELELEAEIRVIERMMKRRNRRPSEAYIGLVKRLYELTREERSQHIGARSDNP
jgi:UDP-N-acetylglucosamine diphosphorylase/glucosamine-1-phosphate N-acetyltransferase